eukprot:1150275-Pelagomonas_calceolata.AAC.7
MAPACVFRNAGRAWAAPTAGGCGCAAAAGPCEHSRPAPLPAAAASSPGVSAMGLAAGNTAPPAFPFELRTAVGGWQPARRVRGCCPWRLAWGDPQRRWCGSCDGHVAPGGVHG